MKKFSETEKLNEQCHNVLEKRVNLMRKEMDKLKMEFGNSSEIA